jgi:D-glycero-beta-D-manno-heptose-7-phosphate kinase
MDILQAKKFKILLVGDNCTDVYQYGTVERISPEAPVPVFKFNHQETKEGMAGNVLKNLLQLNCIVDFITSTETSVKTRLIDIRSKQQLLRVDHDIQAEPLNLSLFSELNYDAIVISDYNKGSVSYELIKDLRNNFKGPVFLDTKKPDIRQFSGIYVKINELEYKNITSINDSLIVTLGSKGAMYKTNIEKLYSTPVVEVSDVCGAGDTFLSALTYEFLNTNDIEKAIMFANKAASITVQKIGNYAPSIEEITNV